MGAEMAFIEENIPSAHARNSGIMNAVIQFEVRDGETRIFHYQIRNGIVKVFPGHHARPDVVIGTTLDTWIGIVTGKIRPIRAYVMGEVNVMGDIVLAQRAIKLFSRI
jgi:putative sterol carrier protein